MTDQPLKMAANKTFQVSRKSQYKREKPRSPLTSLNEGKAVRERSVSEDSHTEIYRQKSEEQRALNSTQSHRSLSLSDQENICHVQRNSPDLCVAAGKLMNCGSMSASPSVALAGKPENKDLAKMLNKTLSPIGTPERFKKLMPHIYSESPLSVAVMVANNDDSDSALSVTPVPSLKDALALIDSDLSHINTSPQNTSSSCGFSDSLESNSGSRDCGPGGNVVKAFPDSPQGSESGEQRLTFFVSKNVASEVVVAETDKATERAKKASFISATVTKSKAPVEVNGSTGRKIKKSRRRLLEKTLELSDGSSQCESGPDTPSLPVIDSDTGTRRRQNSGAASSLSDESHQAQGFISSSLAPQLCHSPPTIAPPPSMASAHFTFSVASPPPAADALISFTITSASPLGSSSPLHVRLNPNVFGPSPTVPMPSSIQEDLFPVQVVGKSKKRKSEEFLKSDGKVEDAGKMERVKRSRVGAGKTRSSGFAQDRRVASQRRTTGEQISGCLCCVQD